MSAPGLFVCATDFEARMLLRGLNPGGSPALQGNPDSPYKFWKQPDSGVTLVVTGIGPRAARQGLIMALSELDAPPRWAVGFGLCGGLLKTAAAGDLVIPTKVLLDREEEIPTEWLRMSLAAHAASVPLRSLITSSELVASAGEKAAIFAAKGAEAVDMESAVWGSIFRERGIPWAIVRTVLDPADEQLPESFSGLWDRFGNPIWPRLLGFFLIHPLDVLTTLRVGRIGSRVAGPPLVSLLIRWLAAERV